MRAEYQEAAKKRIVEVTKKLLQKGGHELVTIRKIAHELEMSVGSVYTYFFDKTAILKEVYIETCRDFLNTLECAVSQKHSAEENCLKLMQIACEFRIQNAYRYRDIYDTIKDQEPPELEQVRAFMRHQLANLNLSTLKDPRTLKQAEKTFLACCEGIALAAKELKEKKELTHTIEFAFRTLISGWKNMVV